LTSTPFLIGVVVGAVGAWLVERRRIARESAGQGVGGARRMGRVFYGPTGR